MARPRDRWPAGIQRPLTWLALLNRAGCANVSVAQSAQAAHRIDISGMCSQHGIDQGGHRVHVGFGKGAEQLAHSFASGSSQFPFGVPAGRCRFQAKGAACSVSASHPVDFFQSVNEANRSGMGQFQDPVKFIDAQPGVGDDRDQGGRCCASETCGLFAGSTDDIAEGTGPSGDDVVITPRWTDMHDSY